MRGAWFQNRSAGDAVRFTLRGLDYIVPQGQAVELPAELAWYPAAVGLLLEPCTAPSETARADEPTPAQPRRRRLPDGVYAGAERSAREPELSTEEEVEIEPAVSAALARRRR